MEMTTEEKQAYEWALKQQFQSVSARYARLLAQYIQRNNAARQDAQEDLLDCLACGLPEREHNTPGINHIFVAPNVNYDKMNERE